MTRFIRDLRVIPIVLVATAGLLVLTLADLLFDGGRWFARNSRPHDADAVIHVSPNEPPSGKLSWAHEMFNFPAGTDQTTVTSIAPPPITAADARSINAAVPGGDITGSIAGAPSAAGPGAAAPSAASGAPAVKDAKAGTPRDIFPADGAALPTGAERAILERLQQRRVELDARSRELDIRETMVKAAEKRIAAQLAELKEVEARIGTEATQKDAAEANRFKGLVTMYENMKARDAAKIFDGLDMDVLLKVASQINPRQMADIMAQMNSEVAQRLTIEMASKAQQTGNAGPEALPKIEGRPTSP